MSQRVSTPKPISDLLDWRPDPTVHSPAMVQRLEQAFAEGKRRARNATANSAQPNISSEPDTHRTKPSGSSESGLTTTETVASGSPVRRKATADELEGVVLKLGLTTGHVVERHRAALIADAMLGGEWTVAEIEAAYRAIVGSARLMKEISFERTVGPGVFAQARETPQVMRHRLFEDAEARRMARKEKAALGEMFEAVRAEEDNRVLWRMRPDQDIPQTR